MNTFAMYVGLVVPDVPLEETDKLREGTTANGLELVCTVFLYVDQKRTILQVSVFGSSYVYDTLRQLCMPAFASVVLGFNVLVYEPVTSSISFVEYKT